MACFSGMERKVNLKLMVDKKANKVVFAEAGQEFAYFLSQIKSLPRSNTRIIVDARVKVNAIGVFYNWMEWPSVPNSELNSESGTTAEHLERLKDGVAYMVMDNLEVKPMSIDVMKPYLIGFNLLEEKNIQVGNQQALAILNRSLRTTGVVLTSVFLRKEDKAPTYRQQSPFRKTLKLMVEITSVLLLAIYFLRSIPMDTLNTFTEDLMTLFKVVIWLLFSILVRIIFAFY